MLDIGGYRAGQRARLVELAEDSVARVKETGEPVSLDAMSPFERKVVHDAVAEAGLHLGVRGRRAPSLRRDPAGLTGRRMRDVSRETPAVPEVARRVFSSDRLVLAERYADLLATDGRPARADRSPRGAPALGPTPAELRRAGRGRPSPGERGATWAPGPACPAWCWRSPGPDLRVTLVEPLLRRTTLSRRGRRRAWGWTTRWRFDAGGRRSWRGARQVRRGHRPGGGAAGAAARLVHAAGRPRRRAAGDEGAGAADEVAGEAARLDALGLRTDRSCSTSAGTSWRTGAGGPGGLGRSRAGRLAPPRRRIDVPGRAGALRRRADETNAEEVVTDGVGLGWPDQGPKRAVFHRSRVAR